MKKEATAAKKPRKAPDFSGVPGEIVSIAALNLDFASRRGKVSPYDALLDQLDKAPKDSALRFENPRALASLMVRGRKKGLVLVFAEALDGLYVKIAGHADDDKRAARNGAVLRALRNGGPATSIGIANRLREAGDELVDAAIVDAIATGFQKTGEILRQGTGNWAINPNFKGKQ